MDMNVSSIQFSIKTVHMTEDKWFFSLLFLPKWSWAGTHFTKNKLHHNSTLMEFFDVIIPFLVIILQQLFAHVTSSDFIVRIWLRAKQNFHPIWIMTEKS